MGTRSDTSGLMLPAAYSRVERRVRVRDHLRVHRAVEAPVQANHGVVLHQHVPGRDRRDPARGEADHDQPALERDAPPGRVEHVPADRVPDHVRAVPAGHLLDPGAMSSDR